MNCRLNFPIFPHTKDLAERLAEEVLSFPMYPELLSADLALIIETVNSYPTACSGT